MKKTNLLNSSFLIKVFLMVSIITLLLLFIIPYIMNINIKNKLVTENHTFSEYFNDDYDSIRENFLKKSIYLDELWGNSKLTSFPIEEKDNLYIDSILLNSKVSKTNLIIITTGVHGVEGYIGAAMLQIFIDKYIPNLNKDNTSILLISNVNPYGMKYKRRYNENNVDLNRNFIFNWNDFDKTINTDYPKIESFLEPQKPIGTVAINDISFISNTAWEILTKGTSTISNALLEGQYTNPKGVYYGGNADEKSTKYVKNIFKNTLNEGYENIIHLDLHSGYGPRYDMSIFNAAYDKTTYKDAKEDYNYSQIITVDSPDFYATTGDITTYYYQLNESLGSPTNLYSTCLEFGTLGDDLLSSIKSMKNTIEENRNHFFPTKSKTTDEIIKANYSEMFFPAESKWRVEAVEDFMQATTGILNNKLK